MKKNRIPFEVSAAEHRLTLGKQTRVMGVINVTPDSFSLDGCFENQKEPLHKSIFLAKKFIRQGADILDVGGESSRPGSKRISVQEEVDRIIPTVKALIKNMNILISVDTYKPVVAKHALDAGASMINNIMGAKPSKKLLRMVKNYKAAIVLMHMQGTPQRMQRNIFYKDVVHDIMKELRQSISECLDVGIKRNQIIIDPGIGFGKTLEHNLEIIRRLKDFQKLNLPILMGTSRKSFIGKILNKDVKHRLSGTLATVCASVMNGAHIVRVHDVKETKDVVTIMDQIS